MQNENLHLVISPPLLLPVLVLTIAPRGAVFAMTIAPRPLTEVQTAACKITERRMQKQHEGKLLMQNNSLRPLPFPFPFPLGFSFSGFSTGTSDTRKEVHAS